MHIRHFFYKIPYNDRGSAGCPFVSPFVKRLRAFLLGKYARITAVKDGTECERISTGDKGWHAAKAGCQVSRVSEKYSETTTA